MVAVNGTSHPTTEYEGIVARVNERGLLFQGREGWVNVSKFAGSVALPAVGQRVRCSIDGSGFIRSIAPVDAPEPEPRQVHAVAPQDAPAAAPSKDTTITRLAVLKAAAEYAAWRQDTTPDDVLDIASQWEAWVTR